MGMKEKMFLVAVGIVALGIGAWYYFWFADSSKKTVQSPYPVSDHIKSNLRLNANAIYVPDQEPGEKVFIGFAGLREAGFVVIREAEGGSAGAVIGRSNLLQAGNSGSMPPITLSRRALDGETFIAMLYRDNGDGIFDPEKDSPAIDTEGKPIAMEFAIDREATLPDAMQP